MTCLFSFLSLMPTLASGAPYAPSAAAPVPPPHPAKPSARALPCPSAWPLEQQTARPSSSPHRPVPTTRPSAWPSWPPRPRESSRLPARPSCRRAGSTGRGSCRRRRGRRGRMLERCRCHGWWGCCAFGIRGPVLYVSLPEGVRDAWLSESQGSSNWLLGKVDLLGSLG
jgi:hypothetical protein